VSLTSLSKEGAFSEDEEPNIVFNFKKLIGDFYLHRAYFELSKDESELIMRYLDKGIIDEYLMSGTTPRERFTKIDK
jgi:hypothetical protein